MSQISSTLIKDLMNEEYRKWLYDKSRPISCPCQECGHFNIVYIGEEPIPANVYCKKCKVKVGTIRGGIKEPKPRTSRTEMLEI